MRDINLNVLDLSAITNVGLLGMMTSWHKAHATSWGSSELMSGCRDAQLV